MSKMTDRVLQHCLLFCQLFYFVWCQKTVNLLIINDDVNKVAEEAVTGALNYINDNEGNNVKIGNKFMATNNISDVYSSLDNLCQVVDTAMESDGPPHLIIDTTRNGLSSEIVKSLTLALAVPTISMSYGLEGDLREWRTLDEEQNKYLVQVMPPGDGMVYIIRQIVSEQNMTSAAVLYDDTFVMEQQYTTLLMNLPTRHIINRIETTEAALRNQTSRIRDVDIANYFVVGSPESIDRVLSMAESLKMYGRKYAWFSLSKQLSDDVKCSQCENTKVVFIRPMEASLGNINSIVPYGVNAMPKVDAAFYFDTTIRSIQAIAEMMNSNRWPIDFKTVGCKDYVENDPPTRTNLDFRGALESTKPIAFTDITWKGNGMTLNQFKLDIFQVSIMNKKKVNQKKLGSWTTTLAPERIVFESGQSFTDFNAVTVYRVVTVIQPPFMMRRMTPDGNEEFYGYCVDLINEIKALIGFEYELYEAPDKKFGTMNENNEWNGMIKELIDKKADIALAPLSVMAERENVVDFTVPYYDLVGIAILMKKPKIPTSLFKFLTVLETDVWFCILAAYVFTSLLLWVFDRFSPYSYQNNKEKYKDDDEKREFSLKECLWFCMTSLTPQGGGEAPKNLSGRLVAATWWLFGFIIIASYTANLAAFLTVSRLETPVEGLDDLSKQYKIQYSPMNGTATMTYFERMAYIEYRFYEIWKDMSLNDSLSDVERAKLAVWDYPVSDRYTKMWQTMREAGLPTTFDGALDRVLASKSSSEGYAYLGDATDIRYQELINCDFQMVGDEFSRKPYALAVQQGSPVKDQLNDAILKLLNQRKLETLKERWWNQNPMRKRCDDTDDQNDGISIYNIGGVFIVIFVGIVMAICTLAFEYWYYKHKKGPRVSDSAKVLAVREFNNGDKKSNFNTEYNKYSTTHALQ